MSVSSTISRLCKPAYIYLILAVFGIIMLMIQNYGNTKKYCVGKYTCIVPNTLLVFIFKFAFVAFWTFILDVLCKAGYTNVSWFLLFLPFIFFVFFFGLGMFVEEKLMKNKK